MGAWRRKLVFLLIVYFAGFATAIYCLAPAPEYRSANPDDESFVGSTFKSDEFAKSFNSGMHKCLDFGKDAARQAGTYLKQRLDKDKQS